MCAMPVYDCGDQPVSSIERYRPNEVQHNLVSVDLEGHILEGRTTLVLDAESTFVEFDGWNVDEAIIEKLRQAREQGMERIVITTNKRPKSEDDLWQLQWWAEQIGADLVIVPLAADQRKPSPHMLLQVMEHYDILPDTMLMVGDKLSGDVAAANSAGVHSVWVDRLGNADLLADRLGRRPAEQAFAKLALRGALATEPLEPKTYKKKGPSKSKRKDIEVPEYIAQKGLIAGYGGPEIALSEYKLSLVPPLISDTVKTALPSVKSESFDAFMAEHGGLVADISTYSRLGFGILTLVLLEKGHKKAALAAYAAGQASDLIDGWASRKSSEDPNSAHRKKMGIREANYDKLFSLMVGAGLVRNGSKSIEVFATQQLRELTRGPQRKHFKAKGLDTRATRSSKNSTTFLALADGLTIPLGSTDTTESVQWLATAGKYASSLHSPTVWKANKHHQEEAARVAKLLATS